MCRLNPENEKNPGPQTSLEVRKIYRPRAVIYQSGELLGPGSSLASLGDTISPKESGFIDSGFYSAAIFALILLADRFASTIPHIQSIGVVMKPTRTNINSQEIAYSTMNIIPLPIWPL